MNHPVLIKTCSHCGLQKPLSAFLLLVEHQGTTYGNICATCRKAATKKQAAVEKPDDQTTSTTGHRIDAKAKVQAEIDKRQLRKEIEISNQEEHKKIEEDKHRAKEKSAIIIEHEKERREQHKQSSFLSGQRKISAKAFSPLKTDTPTTRPIVPVVKEEEIDLSTGSFRDTEFAGKVKYAQSSIFQQFKSWLGKSAPIAQDLKTDNPAEENKKESVVDYVHRTWGKR